MKLKNKLIPLTTLATLSGIVAPIALTSCAEQDTFFQHEIDEDWKPSFTPTTAETPLTKADATTLYYQSVTDPTKSSLFSEDLCAGLYTKFIRAGNWEPAPEDVLTNAVEVSPDTKINKLIVRTTQPKFGSATIDYPGEGSFLYPTITFKLRVEFDVETKYTSTSSTDFSSKETHVGSFEVDYKDVIFMAYQSNSEDEPIHLGDDSWWAVGILGDSYAYQYNETPWYINAKFNVDTKRTYTSKSGIEKTVTFNNSYDKKIDSYNTLRTELLSGSDYVSASGWDTYDYQHEYVRFALAFDFKSYYLSNVVAAPELVIDYLSTNSIWDNTKLPAFISGGGLAQKMNDKSVAPAIQEYNIYLEATSIEVKKIEISSTPFEVSITPFVFPFTTDGGTTHYLTMSTTLTKDTNKDNMVVSWSPTPYYWQASNISPVLSATELRQSIDCDMALVQRNAYVRYTYADGSLHTSKISFNPIHYFIYRDANI